MTLSRKAQYVIVAVLILALALVYFKVEKDYGLFFPRPNPCPPLSMDADEEGNYVPPENLTCYDGVWVPKSPAVNYTRTVCETQYLLRADYWDGSAWHITRQYAQGEQYCLDGVMVDVSTTCGGPSYTCDPGENEDNCWADCGPIQDWGRLEEVVSGHPELSTYLQNEYEFIFLNPIIQQAVAEVEAGYDTSTPFMYIKSAVAYLKDRLSYTQTGVVQCGEASYVSLSRGTGNCVDYSVNLVALLRAKGIPARQVAGCVSNYNWRCTPFEALQFEFDLRGILGHAWAEVWTGESRGWVQTDPTTGISLARSCVGYHKIDDTDKGNLCWISDPANMHFCMTF